MTTLLDMITAIDDPFISWVRTDDDICDSVLYRIRAKYAEELQELTGSMPEIPEIEADLPECGEGGDQAGILIFRDGSLYSYSNGDPEVWADASDWWDAYRADFEKSIAQSPDDDKSRAIWSHFEG